MKFTAVVRDLSHKGLGVIDHPDGRVFFARGAWPGDEGEFEVADQADSYEEAQLIKIEIPSPHRIEVACPHRGITAGSCGGCPWMMATYDSQLSFKVKRLQHALKKRGISIDGVLRPIIPSTPYHYRNRAQFKTNGEVLGYVSEGTNILAPVENCLILNPKLNELFHSLKASLPREEFRPTGEHKWCFVDVDDEVSTKDVKVNKRRPFRQGNTEQNQKMRLWISEKFNSLPRHWPVIDLFCGSGNFTEVLSEMGFSNILAVEVQGIALEELRKKALPGVRILELDMNEKGSWSKVAKFQPHAKAILLDPPREGIEKRRGLFKYLDNLEHIFYISCELDTYSRDVADMVRHSWRLKEVTPIDLFPHTPHVEIMSFLSKA